MKGFLLLRAGGFLAAWFRQEKKKVNVKRRKTAIFLVWWKELFGHGIILYYSIWADPFVLHKQQGVNQVYLGKRYYQHVLLILLFQSCLTMIIVVLVQAANRGRVGGPNITKYSAKALPVSTGSCLSFIAQIIWLILIIDSPFALSCSSKIMVTECSQIWLIWVLEMICCGTEV